MPNDTVTSARPAPPADDYVSLRNLVKEFNGFRAVDDVTFSIRKGEIFALLGASGCGKSTLLRMIGGFERPDSGSIVLDGESLIEMPPYERPVNMMFQSYALFPHMTVEDNVAFGLRQDRRPTAEIKERVAEILKVVQMETYARRKPHQLSGGQQQRVALARSLAKRPKLLLLDEPMGALDKKLRTRMQLEIVDILERLGVTCVMVTHDQEEAMTMANRIAIMDRGVIRQIGSPSDIYEQPSSRFTAEFIGSVNLFDGRVKDDQVDYITIESPDLKQLIYVGHGVTCFAGQEVAFAIRPEKIQISKAKPDRVHNVEHGVVQDIAYFGSHSVYHIRLDSGRMVMSNFTNIERWGSESVAWKDEVWISWDDNAGLVLTS
jgi:putrescine transport system ATP-binding protein